MIEITVKRKDECTWYGEDIQCCHPDGKFPHTDICEFEDARKCPLSEPERCPKCLDTKIRTLINKTPIRYYCTECGHIWEDIKKFSIGMKKKKEVI